MTKNITAGLSKNKTKVLQALAETKDGLTRSQMSELLNIHKGWAKLLGAYTKGAGGMEAEGLVASRKIDGVKGIVYVITDQGRKALKGQAQTPSEDKPVEAKVTKTRGKGKAKPEVVVEDETDRKIREANEKAKAKREKAKAKGGKGKAKETAVVQEAPTAEVMVPVMDYDLESQENMS